MAYGHVEGRRDHSQRFNIGEDIAMMINGDRREVAALDGRRRRPFGAPPVPRSNGSLEYFGSSRAFVPFATSTAELLKRCPNPTYGPKVHDLVAGKRLLVTGAGGSIGSEIVRQLETLHPAAVYLLDHDETSLHHLELQLHGNGLLCDDRTILADIRDRAGMRRIFFDIQPEIVYHAAAHKHLPLLERYPSEGVKTNILGTENVVAAAVEAGADLFINISTDKAARPVSVLGVTKRLAEMIVSDHAGRGTRIASVRFGNVLGSRGSFLESLAFQIANGQPVTVTDQDVTRFFMTIPEAAGLVIEASLMADHGETYLLDMGEPVRITELVQRFAALFGIEAPDVRFTGLRSGEKLHEQLFDGAEDRAATEHPRIWAVQAKQTPPPHFRRKVDCLYQLTVEGRVDDLLHELVELLPTNRDEIRSESPQPALAALAC
jgi:FlaA1/EpsC-like NDP-sugar epimerase